MAALAFGVASGSGKSLADIIPAVDDVLRTGSGAGIKAVVVYPMHALANSQREELRQILDSGVRRQRTADALRSLQRAVGSEHLRLVAQNHYKARCSSGGEEVGEVATASWYVAEYFFSLIEKLTRAAGSSREPAMAKGRS